MGPVNQQSPFLGYAGGPQLTQDKVLQNVFRPGDKFFNTGDLLVCDRHGFLSFHDRTGDTFRYPDPWPIPASPAPFCLQPPQHASLPHLTCSPPS